MENAALILPAKNQWIRIEYSEPIYRCCLQCGWVPIEGMKEYRAICGYAESTCVLCNANLAELESISRGKKETPANTVSCDCENSGVQYRQFLFLRIAALETALRACVARAGNAVTTDPAEGCRQVIRTAQDALEGKEGES